MANIWHIICISPPLCTLTATVISDNGEKSYFSWKLNVLLTYIFIKSLICPTFPRYWGWSRIYFFGSGAVTGELSFGSCPWNNSCTWVYNDGLFPALPKYRVRILLNTVAISGGSLLVENFLSFLLWIFSTVLQCGLLKQTNKNVMLSPPCQKV